MSEIYFGKILAEKYPWTVTSDQMKYGLYLGCDEGWYPLIDNCLEEIQNWYANNSPNAEQLPNIGQIKEKFGGLRIYLSYGPDAVWKIIEKYETLSDTICELCSSTKGTLHHKNRWLKTLCPDCAKKEGFELYKKMSNEH